ncbi:MAG: hypothetical protein HY810_08785 [Candidatus Omnitrophica bacterium]|nr:hypothetical protein [Candidatus Omnitrophota bacterium]
MKKILKIISIILIQVFLVMDSGSLSEESFFIRQKQPLSTLAPSVLIDGKQFMIAYQFYHKAIKTKHPFEIAGVEPEVDRIRIASELIREGDEFKEESRIDEAVQTYEIALRSISKEIRLRQDVPGKKNSDADRLLNEATDELLRKLIELIGLKKTIRFLQKNDIQFNKEDLAYKLRSQARDFTDESKIEEAILYYQTALDLVSDSQDKYEEMRSMMVKMLEEKADDILRMKDGKKYSDILRIFKKVFGTDIDIPGRLYSMNEEYKRLKKEVPGGISRAIVEKTINLVEFMLVSVGMDLKDSNLKFSEGNVVIFIGGVQKALVVGPSLPILFLKTVKSAYFAEKNIVERLSYGWLFAEREVFRVYRKLHPVLRQTIIETKIIPFNLRVYIFLAKIMEFIAKFLRFETERYVLKMTEAEVKLNLTSDNQFSSLEIDFKAAVDQNEFKEALQVWDPTMGKVAVDLTWPSDEKVIITVPEIGRKVASWPFLIFRIGQGTFGKESFIRTKDKKIVPFRPYGLVVNLIETPPMINRCLTVAEMSVISYLYDLISRDEKYRKKGILYLVEYITAFSGSQDIKLKYIIEDFLEIIALQGPVEHGSLYPALAEIFQKLIEKKVIEQERLVEILINFYKLNKGSKNNTHLFAIRILGIVGGDKAINFLKSILAEAKILEGEKQIEEGQEADSDGKISEAIISRYKTEFKEIKDALKVSELAWLKKLRGKIRRRDALNDDEAKRLWADLKGDFDSVRVFKEAARIVEDIIMLKREEAFNFLKDAAMEDFVEAFLKVIIQPDEFPRRQRRKVEDFLESYFEIVFTHIWEFTAARDVLKKLEVSNVKDLVSLYYLFGDEIKDKNYKEVKEAIYVCSLFPAGFRTLEEFKKEKEIVLGRLKAALKERNLDDIFESKYAFEIADFLKLVQRLKTQEQVFHFKNVLLSTLKKNNLEPGELSAEDRFRSLRYFLNNMIICAAKDKSSALVFNRGSKFQFDPENNLLEIATGQRIDSYQVVFEENSLKLYNGQRYIAKLDCERVGEEILFTNIEIISDFQNEKLGYSLAYVMMNLSMIHLFEKKGDSFEAIRFKNVMFSPKSNPSSVSLVRRYGGTPEIKKADVITLISRQEVKVEIAFGGPKMNEPYFRFRVKKEKGYCITDKFIVADEGLVTDKDGNTLKIFLKLNDARPETDVDIYEQFVKDKEGLIKEWLEKGKYFVSGTYICKNFQDLKYLKIFIEQIKSMHIVMLGKSKELDDAGRKNRTDIDEIMAALSEGLGARNEILSEDKFTREFVEQAI